jgi:hypothetical protein
MRARFHVLPVLVVTVVSLFAAGVHAAAEDKPKDRVFGAIWSYKLTRDGAKPQAGTLRVYRDDVFLKDKKVGTVRRKGGGETLLTIGGIPEMKGTALLRKTERHPAVGVGKFKKEDGTEWDMRVEIDER